MKFELTFKVVLLFSYQGFVFLTQLLYFITLRSLCQELFLFRFAILLNSLYILSLLCKSVKNFFVIIYHNGEEGI